MLICFQDGGCCYRAGMRKLGAGKAAEETVQKNNFCIIIRKLRKREKKNGNYLSMVKEGLREDNRRRHNGL